MDATSFATTNNKSLQQPSTSNFILNLSIIGSINYVWAREHHHHIVSIEQHPFSHLNDQEIYGLGIKRCHFYKHNQEVLHILQIKVCLLFRIIIRMSWIVSVLQVFDISFYYSHIETWTLPNYGLKLIPQFFLNLKQMSTLDIILFHQKVKMDKTFNFQHEERKKLKCLWAFSLCIKVQL